MRRAGRWRSFAVEAAYLAVALVQRLTHRRPVAGPLPAAERALAAHAPGAYVLVTPTAERYGHVSLEPESIRPLVQGLRGDGWRVRARPARGLMPRNWLVALLWSRSGLWGSWALRGLSTMLAGTPRFILEVVSADGRSSSATLVTLMPAPPAARQDDAPSLGAIDAVITWVDDSDPGWRAALKAVGGDPSFDRGRWRNHGEGALCIQAVLASLPWVRTVHVLTAGQRPETLGDDPRVRFVDHADVFPDSGMLPTFNSHAIESCLHLIPGLAEHFIYFNDDVIPVLPMPSASFFDASGRPIVVLGHVIPQGRPTSSTWWAAAGHAADLVDEELGATERRMLKHAPIPLTRAIMGDAEHAYPRSFDAARRSPLRSVSDVAPVALSLQRALQQGAAVPGGPYTLELQPGSRRSSRAAVRMLEDLDPPVVCVNDRGQTSDPVPQVLGRVRYHVERGAPSADASGPNASVS